MLPAQLGLREVVHLPLLLLPEQGPVAPQLGLQALPARLHLGDFLPVIHVTPLSVAGQS